jgi:hypothetical protein
MESRPDFLIEGIMPSQEVHLLCGPSGAGKSTWLFQMLDSWQEGKPVFGHESFPVPYVYVSADRSLKSVIATLTRLSLQDKITRLITLDDLPSGGLEVLANTALKKYPDSQLLIVEGVQTFTGERIKEYGSVSNFLKMSFHKLCKARGLTVLGTGHSPKVKENERFTHPREKALGSVAWGAFADLIIIIELDEKTRVRTVSLLPRNSVEEQHTMMSGPNGMLLPCPREKGERLALVILSYSEGQIVTTARIVEIAEDMEISKATTERVIQKCVEDGYLERIEEGIYKRPFVS